MLHDFLQYQYVSRWLTVLLSLWRSVRTAESLTAEIDYGEVSLRQSVFTAKYPYGETHYGEKSYCKKSGNWQNYVVITLY